MRINMSGWLIALLALSIIACTPIPEDESYGSGYVVVNETFWAASNSTPYPFTSSGEISCVDHQTFGRGVYFEPAGFTDESYIGTPLNKAAVATLEQAGMVPNVPYSIKSGADLSEAVEIGLRVCGEQQDLIDKS